MDAGTSQVVVAGRCCRGVLKERGCGSLGGREINVPPGLAEWNARPEPVGPSLGDQWRL